MWQLLEPYHAVVYFEPDAKSIYERAGLKGYWMGYFASRAAAMGPVPAEVVIAAFYNFNPAMVRRAIPDAWRFSSPERVLEARYVVADRALHRLLGAAIGSADVATAAGLVRRAAAACELTGRPLFAAHTALPWPSQPHMVLWHGATLLREHRGDGHVASLTIEAIDGCEANAMMAAAGAVPEGQRTYRGWSDGDWDAAMERLEARGLLDGDGHLTDAGRSVRRDVEERTDTLAAPSFAGFEEVDVAELTRIMDGLGTLIQTGDGVPFPNPMGLTRAGTSSERDRHE